MFLGLGAILLIAWILSFAVFHIAGAFIHLLLVVAVIACIWHFVSGRKKTM
jgi:uncharacterized membrane protein YqjE